MKSPLKSSEVTSVVVADTVTYWTDPVEIGDILKLRTEAGYSPLIVTSIGPDGFNGQVFLNGTETQFIENTTFGDAVGQCLNSKKEV